MRVILFGIHQIGLCAMTEMVEHGMNVVAVVTKPSTELEQQPVAVQAARAHLPVLQPVSPRTPGFIQELRGLKPDLIAVAGYHRVIPKEILDIPSWGTINLHDSLLPMYRGPNSWRWVLINGETQTGVTVHIMTPELDNGDILGQEVIPIDDDDNEGVLFGKISQVGSQLLTRTVAKIMAGTVERRAQDESLATYYGYPAEHIRRIDWRCDAQRIRNLIRGSSPRPGAWTLYGDHRLTIAKATISHDTAYHEAGMICDCSSSHITVATSTLSLFLQQVSIYGEHDWGVDQLVRRLGMKPGDRFV